MKNEYLLGLFFIGAVAVIWAASSVLLQYLYADSDFDSPFFVTYFGVSLFILWLLPGRRTNAIADSSYESLPTSDDSHSTPQEGAASPQDAEQPTNTPPWTDQDHWNAALKIAPVWFVANWTYNSSLEYTSITSSTVLASTGSLFTFIFAVCLKDEQFHWYKLLGVLLGMSGSVLTALQDTHQRRHRQLSELSVLGDFLGLISAVGYGGYAVQTRVLCPKDESLYSMRILLGYIGLICCVGMSPILIFQLIFGTLRSELNWTVLGSLFLKGLFDNFLSDYLWLRAVMLTSATVATVGLGLTIPLAFVSDVFLKLNDSNVISQYQIGGALAVLVGFILVNASDDTVPAEGDDFLSDEIALSSLEQESSADSGPDADEDSNDTSIH